MTKNDNFVDTKDASESIIDRLETELEEWKTECNIYFKERNQETRRADQLEQKLWDDKRWIESYCSDAEYWKEQAEEARKSWERAVLQRQELLDQLYELFEAAQAYADMSKHIYRECEDTKQLLEKYDEK